MYNAWIWLFSSKHSTSALSGGFKYNPTTSVSFSRNFASLESLNVPLRCGLILCSCHKRLTVLLLTSCASAMSRQLQWVMPTGLLCKVASMIASRLTRSLQGRFNDRLTPDSIVLGVRSRFGSLRTLAASHHQGN